MIELGIRTQNIAKYKTFILTRSFNDKESERKKRRWNSTEGFMVFDFMNKNVIARGE